MRQEKQFVPTEDSLAKIDFAVKTYDEQYNKMPGPDVVLTDKEKVIDLIFGEGAYKFWCSRIAIEKARIKAIEEFDQSKNIAARVADKFGTV